MRKCMFALLGACLAGVVSLTTAAVNEAPAKADLSPEMLQLERRAQGGDVAAQAELGAAYSLGNGVDKDFGQARQWLSRAADKGTAIAQSLLAILYRDGLGVAQDNVKAYTWYASAGVWDGDGETLTPGDPRLTLSTKMTPEQIEQANQAATAWWENHFKQDSGAP